MKQQEFSKLAILHELHKTTLFSGYLQEQLHIKIILWVHVMSFQETSLLPRKNYRRTS